VVDGLRGKWLTWTVKAGISLGKSAMVLGLLEMMDVGVFELQEKVKFAWKDVDEVTLTQVIRYLEHPHEGNGIIHY
jgi:hypothetical protein